MALSVTKYPKIATGKSGSKKSVSSISSRVVPTLVFDAPDRDKVRFLKRWIGLKIPANTNNESLMKKLLDWDYYVERIASKVNKIVLRPWAKQKHLTSTRVERGMKEIEEMLRASKEEEIPRQNLFTFAGGFANQSKEEGSKAIASRMTERARNKKKKTIDLRDLL